jgi:hypothetical protein
MREELKLGGMYKSAAQLSAPLLNFTVLGIKHPRCQIPLMLPHKVL